MVFRYIRNLTHHKQVEADIHTMLNTHSNSNSNGNSNSNSNTLHRHKMWLLIAILVLTQAPVNSEDAFEQKKVINPETFMNVSQIICHRGYLSEEYEVLTYDGYYVSLNRIPYGRANPRNREPKPVVFLQHGLLGEGSHWVENLSNNSLGFILADSGYDVWLGNSRGTSWSQRHQHLSADQAEFWDFSFHEMAMYDLPAMINFILQKTGQQQIYYIGYSQGCTIAFIAFSSMPELAQKIKLFFALAPVVTIKHARSPIMRLSVLLDRQFKTFQLLLGRTDASLRIRKLWRFLPHLCRNPLLHKPCANLLFLLGGYNEKNFNTTRLDVYTSHYPDRTSVKTMIHWAQVMKSGEFKAFDYGSENQAVYHQETPPLYRVEEMPVPTAVWSGGEDWAADWRDVSLLLPRITHLVTYGHIPDWNHWDFIWGLDAPERLYNSILELMEGSQ
ncbi:putative lysosomal acid lipase/cholesteryl ester hydrolase [Pezoporus occidentalis]|uniref:putative lysosomal acid lipase/cholesteryl ester hydrolase n=1 Tax=Pezoporus occidentalis TaxID=407982 RepID=UPI002F912FB2